MLEGHVTEGSTTRLDVGRSTVLPCDYKLRPPRVVDLTCVHYETPMFKCFIKIEE